MTLSLIHVLSFEEMESTLELMNAMTETTSAEMVEVKIVLLSSQGLRSGCVQVETKRQSTFDTSGEEMASDMRTHGSTTQEGTCLDSKK